jgi:NTP pyrophosphatase (non-canonical NTP hydrolase)
MINGGALRTGGVLVLTAWIEELEPTAQLRARITRARFGSRPEELTSAAATMDEACEVVRAWLQSLMETAETG